MKSLQCSVSFASVWTKNFLTRWRFKTHGWNLISSSIVFKYETFEINLFTSSNACAALPAALMIMDWRFHALHLEATNWNSSLKSNFSFRSFTMYFTCSVPLALRSLTSFTNALTMYWKSSMNFFSYPKFWDKNTQLLKMSNAQSASSFKVHIMEYAKSDGSLSLPSTLLRKVHVSDQIFFSWDISFAWLPSCKFSSPLLGLELEGERLSSHFCSGLITSFIRTCELLMMMSGKSMEPSIQSEGSENTWGEGLGKSCCELLPEGSLKLSGSSSLTSLHWPSFLNFMKYVSALKTDLTWMFRDVQI